MKKRVFYKGMAYVLLLTLLFQAFGGTHTVHAAHTHEAEAVGRENALFVVSEEELEAEKVLVLTGDETDENDNIVIAGGVWERVIIRRSEEVEKIYLQGVIADVLVIEGGMNCEVQLNAATVKHVVVTEPQTGGIDYTELTAVLKEGTNAGDAWAAYAEYVTVLQALKNEVPKIKLTGNTKIELVEIQTNATVTTTKAAVGKVYIKTVNDCMPISVGVKQYNGVIEMKAVADESSMAMAKVFLDLRGSKPEHFHIQAENAYLATQGEDALIENMEIAGSIYMKVMVDAKNVCLTEETEDVTMKLYADVETMEVNGDANEIALTASSNVGHVKVSGDNATIYGYGALKTAEVTGKNAVVYVPGADVDGEYDKTAPDEMNNMNSSPSKPATPVIPDEPDQPDEPDTPIVPDEPENPDISGTPDEPGEDVHVHTWNIEEATCITDKYCTECDFVGETATGIHSFVEGNVTEPTCTTGGYTTYFCEYCEETELRDIVPATKHTVTVWVNGNVVEGETCEYTQVGTCDVCGEQLVSDTTVTVHNANFIVTVTKAATCVQTGEKTFTCPDCGVIVSTETYENAEAHSWDAGQVIGGDTVYTCENCSKTKTVVAMTLDGVATNELTDSTEVQISSGSSATVAMTLDTATLSQIQGAGSDATVKLSADTLSAEAKETVAENLNEEFKEQLGDSEIYDFSMVVGDEQVTDFDGTVTVRLPYTPEAGEDPAAIVVWYIADNGEVEKISGAVYYDGYVTFETSHFSYYTIVKMSTSERCELYGHLWVDLSIAPTCTTDGQSRKVCQRCASEVEGAIVEATGHNLVRETLQESTCTENGSYRQYCTKCNYSQEGRLPRAPHDTTVTEEAEATCTESGYIIYVCDCGYEKTEVLYATGHNAGADGICINCGQSVGCQHSETEIVAELAPGAKTCEDGVIAKLICVHCGEVISEWTENFHGTFYKVYDKVDLEEYVPGCASSIEKGICACGQVISDWNMMYGNFDNWIMDENFIDQDHYTGEFTYADSGLTVVQNQEYTQVEGCYYERYVEYKVYYNGELKGTYTSTSEDMRHRYTDRYELAEGSQTCEDGLLRIQYCIHCGEVDNTMLINEHVVCENQIDLSEYSACGDVIEAIACPCGEVVENVGLRVECSYSDWQNYTDEDGIAHEVHTIDCTSCELVAVLDRATVAMDGCVATFDYSFTVEFAGEEIYRLDYTKAEDFHMWETSYSFAEGAVDCEDGVVVTRYCSACGLVEDSQVMDWHAYTQEERIDMSDYGDSCGLYFEYASCLCGKEYYYHIQEYGTCQLYATANNYVDEDGVPHYFTTYTCSQCPTSYTWDTVDIQTSACGGMKKDKYVFYYDGEEVGSFEVTEPYERHDLYYVSVTLREGSVTCEDGVDFTNVCRNCDYTGSGRSYDHRKALIASVDLSKYGVACGGSIELYECACGAEEDSEIEFCCNTGVDWNDMIWGNFEEVTSTLAREEHTCADCGTVYTMEDRTTSTNGCNEQHDIYFCIGKDGNYDAEVCVSGYGNYIHEEEETITEATENGVKVRTVTTACANCDEFARVEKYADYADNGEYGWLISREWIYPDGWDKTEWVYSFDSSNGCSRLVIETDSNGYYSETEEGDVCRASEASAEATCTQYGKGVCDMCGRESYLEMYRPKGHRFTENETGNGYYCRTCGIESDTDENAGILFEDLSDSANYKAGYFKWTYYSGEFSIYVMIRTAGGENVVEVPVVTSEVFDSGIISISKADIAACASELGITGSYTVALSMVNEFADAAFGMTFE